MSAFDEIEKIIQNRVKEIMKSGDPEKVMDLSSKFTPHIEKVKDGIKKLENIQNTVNVGDIDNTNLLVYMSQLYSEHDQIAEARKQGRRASIRRDYTLLPLLKHLPISPYSKTTDFFGGGIGSTVIVDRGNGRTEPVSARDVMASIYPGKIAYRWGGSGKQVLVPTGTFYQDLKCDLTRVHNFDEEVQHTLPNGREVRLLTKLNCLPIAWLSETGFGAYPICEECLSLDLREVDGREQCLHLRNNVPPGCRKPVFKLGANIKKETIELNSERRHVTESRNNFLPVFNQIFEQIDYSENLEFLTYATGFTRNVTIGRGPSAYQKSVYVEYDPNPGYKTTTNGLILKLKPIPEKFIDAMINDGFVVRDVLIDIFVQEVGNIIQDNPFREQRSIYESELIVSGIIKALELDSITNNFDLKQIIKDLDSNDFRNDFSISILTELGLYSRQPRMGTDVIQIYAEQISKLTISIDNIRSKIKELIKNSLCYLAYTSGQITSGTDDNELSFMIPKNDEIIIYDSVDGGNGASKLIYEYLGDEDSANLPTSAGFLKPAYFQETLLELLLPCSQGVSERVYFQGLETSFSNFVKNDLITYRFDEIREQENLSPNEFAEIRNNATIRNMVPYSIGKRSLNTAAEENKKIQETANICVHGCVECILLNSWSGPSIPQLERFYVSKYLVDQYFRFTSEQIRVDVNADNSKITTTLENHNAVIISQTVNTGTFDLSELLFKINDFIGKKITTVNGDKTVKFTGIWFDCQIADVSEVEACISMGVI